jgi:hypothetical protein
MMASCSPCFTQLHHCMVQGRPQASNVHTLEHVSACKLRMAASRSSLMSSSSSSLHTCVGFQQCQHGSTGCCKSIQRHARGV